MRSTGALCADKAAAHQELLLGRSRKAEAGRRGQPHVTISKKISPDNQSRETTLKPGICSQVCHKSLLSWENQLLMENKIVIQKLQA